MKKPNIKELITQSTYSTIYNPIFKNGTKDIFAYEALSKFVLNNEDISCTEFFSRLQFNEKLFFHLEKKNKHHQINDADKSKKLILHFDVAVFSEKEYRKFWKEYLSEYKHRIVINIIYQDNLTNDNLKIKKKMVKWLIKHEFEFIINIFDDLDYKVSFYEIEKASYLRIDKEILEKIRKNISYFKLLNTLIDFAHESKTKLIMKHINTKEELMLMEKFSIDYIHGDFFI
ncbi:MAG: EAL domain-containing protein [Arcobacter sp.]|uniref:EAL domain-containing protein n=1 Tax=Arcobacter sp. TaxID=1872629 RepID=UPI003B003ACD